MTEQRERESAGGVLAGRSALVTGAAGAIGREICHRLGERGAIIVALDFDPRGLAEAMLPVVESGVEVVESHVDLTEPDGFAEAIAAIVERVGRIDVLVNNAGALSLGPFENISLDEWNRIMKVNVRGLLFMAIEVGRHLERTGGGGVIVNIGSVAGHSAMRNRAHYCASKAAVTTITKGLALELATQGTRVVGILPKGIQSGMSGNWLSAIDGVTRIQSEAWHEDPEQREHVVATIPAGRPGDPRDIAEAVAFLASEQASYVTGSMLAVDGGYLAGDNLTV